MLTIRTAQLNALKAKREADYVDALVQRLARNFPLHHAEIGVDGLKRLVLDTMQWAAKLRIDTQGAVAVLAELILVYGPELRDSPDREWAMKILKHPVMPGHLKVSIVHERLDAKSQGRRIVMC